MKTTNPTSDSNSQNKEAIKTIYQSERAIKAIVVCMAVGVLGMFLFSLQSSSVIEFTSFFALSLLIAGACSLSGGLLGFLFGIPRTLQQDKLDDTQKNNQDNKNANNESVTYQVNTNLEQISDWLTKILVGVGLTQIPLLIDSLKRYANFASHGLGETQASKPFAVILLLFYIVCGFLLSYLWTRIYFAGALREADFSLVGAKIEQVENKVSELEKQSEFDAKALSVVQRQLNPGLGTSLTQDEITSSILNASPNMKAQLFYLAESVRSKNWEDRKTKTIMERAIPIFKALILSDKDEVYHLNHGKLGFALKDQLKPDWVEAEKELSKAIEIRGPWKSEGWLIYEFNRAICKINLDQNFKIKQESEEKSKASITVDLKDCLNDSYIKSFALKDPLILEWISLNKVNL